MARELLQAEGWHECPSWEAVGAGARPPRLTDQLGDWPQGWQLAPIRSQAGAQAGAWLTAMPYEPA